jgi:hypothetical protein
MPTATATGMDAWQTERRRSGPKPQPGTRPVTIQFEYIDPEKRHRKLPPSWASAVEPRNGVYEGSSRSREKSATLRSGRHEDVAFIFGSMNTLTLENGIAPGRVSTNGRPHSSPEVLNDHSPPPREDVSLVQDKTISRPQMDSASAELPALSRRTSTSEDLIVSQPSSYSESLPPPRCPPGPGPGPKAQLPTQTSELDKAFGDGHPQTPSVQVLEPDPPSPTRKLFSVRSTQSLHSRARSSQPQRKESGDDIIERIKILRADVWSMRSNLSEKRSVLRDMGFEKSIADDRFMKFIRTNSLATLSREDKSKEQDALTKLFEECERLRNEYGPLEDDCNLLENVLNNREYEMQKLEAALDERWTEAPHSQQEATSPHSSAPPSEYSGSQLSQHFHPRVEQYLSKLGDVEIYRERLEWHAEEKLTLEEEKSRRERVGMKLAEADLNWLANYADVEAALESQLEDAEEEAERLRRECYDLGLVDEDGEALDLERQERQVFVDDVDAGIEQSDFVKFPVLLPPPGVKEVLHPSPPLPDFDKEIQQENTTSIDPSDRINFWLLENLRSSPLDVNLLVRIYQFHFGPIKQGDRWQIDVMELWYSDDSKELAKHSARSLSDVATQSTQKTGEQRTSLSGWHSLSLEITKRSSMLKPPRVVEELVLQGNGSGTILPPLTTARREKDGGKSV